MDVNKPPGLTFCVGDRVRLRADGAERWIDSKMRLRARRGIPATVKTVLGPAEVAHRRSYRIEFDKVIRLDPMSEIVSASELEVLNHV